MSPYISEKTVAALVTAVSLVCARSVEKKLTFLKWKDIGSGGPQSCSSRLGDWGYCDLESLAVRAAKRHKRMLHC